MLAAHDVTREKCAQTLPPLRVGESLEIALMRMAAADHRTLSEYCKLVLMRHAFGHVATLPIDEEPRQ